MPKMTTTRALLLATAVSLGHCGVHAQTASQPTTSAASQLATPAASRPATPAATQPFVFKVATIRSAREHVGNGIALRPDGAYASGAPLKWIIRAAYDEKRDALWVGEPAWTENAFYDIEAKFDPALYKDLTDDQRFAMIQALLADRFKLAVHRETRVLPIYTLVVAEGGPKLRESNASKYVLDELNKPYCLAG
jgi:hypothetical protein